jgi:enamine deaminase RidA (YjgF/YER057c/UK114 family)
MKRRYFLKKSAVAASLVSIPGSFLPLTACKSQKLYSGSTGELKEEIRSSDYLQNVQSEEYLPKPIVYRESYQPTPDLQISPMSLAERIRRKVVPQHGFCSIEPSRAGLISGNGPVNIELTGDPYLEQITFQHEELIMPWRRPYEANKVAHIIPQVRQLLLDGNYQEAVELAFNEWQKGPIKINTWGHPTVTAFHMRLDFPKTASVRDYLRTVDFESSEANVYWSDERGNWVRQTFTSRPDNVVVQLLTAPQGKPVNVRITLFDPRMRRRSMSGREMGNDFRGMVSGTPSGESVIQQDLNEERLIHKCRLDPTTDNSGYAGVVRVVRDGGSARMEDGTLVIENASSVTLLTRIEWFADYSEDKVEALRLAVEELTPDYQALVERHRKVQSEAFNRVTIDFGGDSQYGLSSEELLADQRTRPDYSPAFLEKIFEMGRYWFILKSGKYPSRSAEVNANINLQLAPGVLGDHREGMNAYFNWIESLYPDFRTNTKNIFGMRGTHYNLWPDIGMGVAFHYSQSSTSGEMWPHLYWISAGGWCVQPFWDYYLATGDLEFLRNRVVPAYKELALFYEDFLTVTDKDGNYIFVPSFSPENHPGNLRTSNMMVINATMDITVCREVLNNLITACETLGADADNVTKWKAMLAKMPSYMIEKDGTLKEWAWPTLEENYNHRHVSHLYGAWPGDDINPDSTPQFARAALMHDRKRDPETLAAHGLCHRALAGARLKDCYLVDFELRQLFEQGYVGTTFRCSHNPYTGPMPDAQGGIPAIMMEMLAYSRPGVIEVLPALPPSLKKGSINGMLARTFARINKLAWDMQERTVDITITSVKKQDITLIARYGIEDISAPSGIVGAFRKGNADCELHLPEKEPVEIHLELGPHKPMDWVAQVTKQIFL